MDRRNKELTAAGLFGILTRFPFHSSSRNGTWKQNVAKVAIFPFLSKEKGVLFGNMCKNGYFCKKILIKMSSEEFREITELVKREVVPAIGCTEPVAVAMCVARATELLGCVPARIEVLMSTNILKNAMGVGIPGTGMIGLPIAVALGALVGKSAYGLEVLRDTTPRAVEQGKQMIEDGCIGLALKEEAPDELYVEAHLWEKRPSQDDTESDVIVILSGNHTRIAQEKVRGELLLDLSLTLSSEAEVDDVPLCMQRIWEYVNAVPLEEIAFIEASANMNMEAARASLGHRYGHQLGHMLSTEDKSNLIGDSTLGHIITYTCAACDARMSGVPVPVMTNSGSGNQGIAATLPVAVYAREHVVEPGTYVRALMLSNLTAIYIKQSLGRLSPLCGCIVASTGASCGITYMMGGDFAQVCAAVKNMIANLTGMICDGAKPSCSLKLSSGAGTALLSAMLAVQGHCVSSLEGIIDEDVDKSIHNLTSIGSRAMRETNLKVMDIMVNK